LCRRGPQIGGNQQLLELLERLIVQLALGKHRGDAAGQFLRAALQAFLQARKETIGHQAASAKSCSPVEPVTRARSSRPGAAGRASRTGAKCSLWPDCSASVSSETMR